MIRAAGEADYASISAVNAAAFGQYEEVGIIEGLRADQDVLFELVAERAGAVIGYILYSRAEIARPEETLSCAVLAPLAVAPALQGRGFGGALVKAGQKMCAELGVAAVIVLGHESYYPRFGFSALAAAPLEAPFSGPSFMAAELDQGCLQRGGRMRYPRAFGV